MPSDTVKTLHFPLNFSFQFRLRWQKQSVTAGEYFFPLIHTKGIFDHRVIFIGTQYKAYRMIITRRKPFPVEIVYIKLYLTKILMGKFADF
ncbi:MAG: hypothetical protein A2268_15195 [Candidatus Raymondbacteria bacterium RifOxyA12_full_50_37]|nr:MAG: hypothetical protein A2268_15195 [Candidatus Raymondbacteria bacterium RifOxyA12_full_50_37]OGJ88499.1 MAG: hypothetical protein A2248_20070 [Candidatus Raymondbacteria bacterium RIFOXYA2_FULL_49_16]OGJ90619.1 MAG: hypothetical protein A2350_18445 [Candidatus Raymondbacteria bacterium RifOxyB12_full_50_8]